MDFLLRPITKIEEQRAFQYIKDTLVPRAVQSYNLRPDAEKKVTADEIRKSLRKVAAGEGVKYSADNEPYVLYVAELTEPNTDHVWKFHFTIQRCSKNSKKPGGIMVHCRFPLAAMCGAYLQESIEHEEPSSEPNKYLISKIEEAEILQHIRSVVVPDILDIWNNKCKKREWKKCITVKQINSNLRKIKHEKKIGTEEFHYITYNANLDPELNFSFEIFKQHPNGIRIIINFPDQTQRHTILREKIEKDDKEPLTESNRSFSKMDEAEILQYIREIFIPHVVPIWNKKCQTNFKWQKDSVTVDQINKNLKKIRHESFPKGDITAENIFYHAHVKSTIDFYFEVLKDSKLEIIVIYPDGREGSAKIDLSNKGKYLTEGIDEDYNNISKMDEQRGLQYIRQIVVPSTVKRWNTSVEISRLHNKEKYKLSVEDINKSLVKKLHFKRSLGQTGGDWIQYNSTPIKPFKFNGPFRFTLSKDRVGELTASASLPGSDEFLNYYIGYSEFDPDSSFSNHKPIKRGIHLKENQVSEISKISKMEEQQALQLIRNKLIPKVVDTYNLKVSPNKRITAEMIGNTLKKWRVVPSNSTEESPVIFYISKRVPNDEGDDFVFTIRKSDKYTITAHPGRLMVHCVLPQEAMSSSSYLQEGIEKDDAPDLHHFSKREEGESIQFIKHVILPHLVTKRNSMLKSQYKKQPNLRVADVQRSFRKVKETRTKHGLFLTYKAEGQRQQYILGLYKDASGTKLVWNIQNGQHWVVGRPLPPDEDTHLTEAGTGPRSITKIEEAELLQNIRTYVIPITAFIWNQIVKNQYRWSGFGVTSEQISKNLVKFDHGSHAANDKNTTDVIRYKSVLWEAPFQFNFECYKRVNNKIIVMIGFPNGLSKHVNPKGPFDLGTIPLKEGLYTEPPDETNLPTITRKEEAEALQYIRKYMVPFVVKYHNGLHEWDNQVSEEEVQKDLQLSGRYPSYNKENPSIGFKSVPRGLYFAFSVHKQIEDGTPDNGKLYVRFRTPDTFSPHEYYVGTPISEGRIKVVHGAGKRLINKMEENEALQYIRNKLIPAAFNSYNYHVMGEFRVRTDDDIRKSLKKIDVEYTSVDGRKTMVAYETIIYVSLVPTIGGKRIQKFTFYISKPDHPQLNRIRVGVIIDGYGSQEFNIGGSTAHLV